MGIVVANMKWIMLVAGALTLTMVYAAFDPQTALRSSFGEGAEGAAANLVVRNWGVLIALVGGMLVYGAFRPASRALVLTVAGLSKVTFIGLVLSQGNRFLAYQAGVAVAIDAVMVLLFAVYLAGSRREGRPAV